MRREEQPFQEDSKYFHPEYHFLPKIMYFKKRKILLIILQDKIVIKYLYKTISYHFFTS